MWLFVDQMPVAVDEWLDFGGMTVTFYHQLPRETILYNIPYNCVEELGFDEGKSLAYISTKRVLGLDGINLVAFMVEAEVNFPILFFVISYLQATMPCLFETGLHRIQGSSLSSQATKFKESTCFETCKGTQNYYSVVPAYEYYLADLFYQLLAGSPDAPNTSEGQANGFST